MSMGMNNGINSGLSGHSNVHTEVAPGKNDQSDVIEIIDESEIIDLGDTDNESDESNNCRSSFLSAPVIVKEKCVVYNNETTKRSLSSPYPNTTTAPILTTTNNNRPIKKRGRKNKRPEHCVKPNDKLQHKIISEAEFKSIKRICNFLGVEIDPAMSFQEIRKVLKDKMAENKQILVTAQLCPVSMAIHIQQLPQWFQNFHVLTLINLVSDVDLDRPRYYIDMFKDDQNRNTGECLIRFVKMSESTQVLHDLHRLNVFNTGIKVALDEDNELSRMRDAQDKRNYNPFAKRKLNRLKSVVNKYISRFKDELEQMRQMWPDDGVIVLQDTDDENSRKCDKSDTLLKVFDGAKELENYDSNIVSKVIPETVDKSHEVESKETKQSSDENVVNTEENKDVIEELTDEIVDKSLEVVNEETKTCFDQSINIVTDEIKEAEQENLAHDDNNIVFFEDKEGAFSDEDENTCSIVSISNIPKQKSYLLITDLIRREFGDIIFSFRKQTKKKCLLKFESHEVAINVCDRLNGVLLEYEKIEVKLTLGHSHVFKKPIRDSHTAYTVKRKVITDGSCPKTQKFTKTSRTERTSTISVSDLKRSPHSEGSDGTNSPSEEDVDKLEISPPLVKMEVLPPLDKLEVSPPLVKMEVLPPLEKLEISPPLNTTIVIDNLNPDIPKGKLKRVFSLAGNVRNVTKLNTFCEGIGLEGCSAKIKFRNPAGAAQAVSMFHNQTLFDRIITVKMDTSWEERPLPVGLQSVGKGFGMNGEPLKDVRNVIARRKHHEAFVEADKQKFPASKKKKSAEYTHIKREQDMCMIQNKNATTNNSTETKSNISMEIDDVDYIKDLSAVLETRGAIPTGSNCEDLESILRALKTNTIATRPNNNQNSNAYESSNMPPNTGQGPSFPNSNDGWLSNTNASVQEDLAANYLPSPRFAQNFMRFTSSNYAQFNAPWNVRYPVRNVWDVRVWDIRPNLNSFSGVFPNMEDRAPSKNYYESVSRPVAETEIQRAASLYPNLPRTGRDVNRGRYPATRPTPFVNNNMPTNLNQNRPNHSNNFNTIKTSRPRYFSRQLPDVLREEPKQEEQPQQQCIDLTESEDEPTYPKKPLQQFNLKEESNKPNYSQQTQPQCIALAEAVEEPIYPPKQEPLQQFDTLNKESNQPSYSQQPSQQQSDNLKATPQQTIHVQKQELHQQFDNLKEEPNSPTNPQQTQSTQQNDILKVSPKPPAYSQEIPAPQKSAKPDIKIKKEIECSEEIQNQQEFDRIVVKLKKEIECPKGANSSNVNQSSKGGEKSDMLLFNKLPRSMSVEALSSKLSEVGDVLFCEMTGFGRAVVRFKNPRDAERCLRFFHLSKVDNQVIEVKLM